MVGHWIRTWHGRLLEPIVGLLARLGITPNALTLSSLALLAAAGAVLAGGHLVLGGCIMLFGAFLDTLDGELARRLGLTSAFGAFLDSITDHCGDMFLHLGLLWWFLQSGAKLEPLLVFVALFGSMLGSQIRSRAGMVGIDTKTVGLATRFERIVVLGAGLFSGQLSLFLWVLAGLTTLSAAQRLLAALKGSRRLEALHAR